MSRHADVHHERLEHHHHVGGTRLWIGDLACDAPSTGRDAAIEIEVQDAREISDAR